MHEAIPVIDMWAPIVPSREITAHVADHFPPAMNGYLRVFFKQDPSPETFRKMAAAMVQDDETIVKALDEADIDRVHITGFDETSTAGSALVTNESVAAIAERHPSRFVPFAGADIMRGAAAVRELEHWVRERGFRGLSLRPFMIGAPATDRHYYPFYEKCV